MGDRVHVTIHLGDRKLVALHDHWVQKRIRGVTFSGHASYGQLIDRILGAGLDVRVFEIVAHGTPCDLGVIFSDTADEIGAAMRTLPTGCSIHLTGCNTAVCDGSAPIAQTMATIARRPVMGTRGYVDPFAFNRTIFSTQRGPLDDDAIYPCSVDANHPKCLMELQPLPHGGQVECAHVLLDLDLLRRALALAITLDRQDSRGFARKGSDQAAIVANEILRAIRDASIEVQRPLLAGTEATFRTEACDFELFGNLSAISHAAESWKLGLSRETLSVFRAAVALVRRGTVSGEGKD